MLLYHQQNLPDKLSEIIRLLIQHEQQPATGLDNSQDAYDESSLKDSFELSAFAPLSASLLTPPIMPKMPRSPTNQSLTMPVREVSAGSPLKHSFESPALIPWEDSVNIVGQDDPAPTQGSSSPGSTAQLRRKISLTRKRLGSGVKNSPVASADSGAHVEDGMGTLV